MSTTHSFTESGLADGMVEAMKRHKDEKQPWPKNRAGMYYLFFFIEAILNNEEMTIHLDHLPEPIRNEIERLYREEPEKLIRVVFKAIKLFLQSYENSNYDSAFTEGLVKWRFV